MAPADERPAVARDSLGAAENDALVSLEGDGGVSRSTPAVRDDLVDISMEEEPASDARWYRCVSVAGRCASLEVTATTTISGKVEPGRVIEALEHASTRAGKRRVRTAKGWVSLVSANGTRLFTPCDGPATRPARAAGSGGPGLIGGCCSRGAQPRKAERSSKKHTFEKLGEGA